MVGIGISITNFCRRWVSTGEENPNPDVTAPILSSPVDAADGHNAATGSVSTDEGNGTLYWVVSTSATGPSASQVKAGQDHTGSTAVDSGSQAVSATGTQTLSPAPSGLTAETGYWLHFMHEDAAANQSNVTSGDGFTTGVAPSGSYSAFASDAPQGPPVLFADDLTNYCLGCKFKFSADGTVTALRFYRNSADTGSRDIRLYEVSGQTQIAVETLADASGPTGWVTVPLSSPVAVTAGALYLVVVTRLATDQAYFATSNVFDSAVVGPGGYVTGVANSESANGVLATASLTNYPTETFNASYYWIDVVFEPTP